MEEPALPPARGCCVLISALLANATAIRLPGKDLLTCENRAPLALLLHPSLLLAGHCERRLKDEAANVVALFKVGLAVLQLLVIQVRRNMGHLNVGILGVQVLGIHLWIHETIGLKWLRLQEVW